MNNKLKTIATLAVLLIIATYAIGCNKMMVSASPIADTTTIIIPPPVIPPVIDTGKGKTWLDLGDSYTIGQSVDSSNRYPAQTASLLSAQAIAIKPIQYIATTGWTTNDLQAAIASRNPQAPFDIVSLLIGVNDQYWGYDTGGYSIRFTQLLQKSIQLAGNKPSHVFVVSIPDYSVTPFANGTDKAAISREIDQFNAINKRITASFNGNYLYITDYTRLAATDSTLIAFDGLHPSGKEYAVWSNLLASMIKVRL